MNYFPDRIAAGAELAAGLQHYRYENTAVVALSEGGVIVGAEIAAQLHCVLTMLLTKPIYLPGENTPLGLVNYTGGFTFNRMIPLAEIDELMGEYHAVVDDLKRQKFSALNALLGDGDTIRPDLLREHNVILVSDGIKRGISLDAAYEYLKPFKIKKLIIVTPVATVEAVDRMHVLADEIHCLNIVDRYFGTDHYYEAPLKASSEKIIATVQNIVLNWR